MKQILIVFLALVFSATISWSQDKKVYDEGYLVRVGDTDIKKNLSYATF
jgi:hypothetical protein